MAVALAFPTIKLSTKIIHEVFHMSLLEQHHQEGADVHERYTNATKTLFSSKCLRSETLQPSQLEPYQDIYHRGLGPYEDVYPWGLNCDLCPLEAYIQNCHLTHLKSVVGWAIQNGQHPFGGLTVRMERPSPMWTRSSQPCVDWAIQN